MAIYCVRPPTPRFLSSGSSAFNLFWPSIALFLADYCLNLGILWDDFILTIPCLVPLLDYAPSVGAAFLIYWDFFVAKPPPMDCFSSPPPSLRAAAAASPLCAQTPRDHILNMTPRPSHHSNPVSQHFPCLIISDFALVFLFFNPSGLIMFVSMLFVCMHLCVAVYM